MPILSGKRKRLRMFDGNDPIGRAVVIDISRRMQAEIDALVERLYLEHAGARP